MRISPQQYEKVMAIYRNQQQNRIQGQEKGQKDTMRISGEARMVKEVRDLLQETPEVRQERVAELKEAVQNGEYKVDSKEVAEKMLQRIAVDSHFLNQP